VCRHKLFPIGPQRYKSDRREQDGVQGACITTSPRRRSKARYRHDRVQNCVGRDQASVDALEGLATVAGAGCHHGQRASDWGA
jgi:hypothetical protein